MFVTNNPFFVNKPDSALDMYVVHPSNNSLSSKTRQKNSKYNQSNEIANVSTIFIPIGFDLYGKLGSETIKLIDSISVFGSIFNLESEILPILYYKFNVLMMWYF
jgi:hypothetical protein